jgi:hypothetical protein
MYGNLPIPEEHLLPCLQETFGADCALISASPLVDGTRKKVYLLKLTTQPGTVVLLAWHNEHDYFNERMDTESSLNDLNAPALYRANTALMLSNHLRVPCLYYFNDTRAAVPYAFGLVEYVQGVTYNTYRQDHSPAQVEKMLNRMRIYLTRMHAVTRPAPGNVFNQLDPVQYIDDFLKAVLTDLARLAKVHPGVRNCEQAVRARLANLHAQMLTRSEFTLIHGELGPDEHFMIDSQGEIILLDIDGCEFGDLEREYAYLKLRFDNYSTCFNRQDLDPIRMQFYGLCLHIFAAYGHYQLLAGGYPGADADELREIYQSNALQVVRLVQG